VPDPLLQRGQFDGVCFSLVSAVEEGILVKAVAAVLADNEGREQGVHGVAGNNRRLTVVPSTVKVGGLVAAAHFGREMAAQRVRRNRRRLPIYYAFFFGSIRNKGEMISTTTNTDCREIVSTIRQAGLGDDTAGT
jgi:hypothetical protein